jgi:hypothetical protein
VSITLRRARYVERRKGGRKEGRREMEEREKEGGNK